MCGTINRKKTIKLLSLMGKMTGLMWSFSRVVITRTLSFYYHWKVDRRREGGVSEPESYCVLVAIRFG